MPNAIHRLIEEYEAFGHPILSPLIQQHDTLLLKSIPGVVSEMGKNFFRRFGWPGGSAFGCQRIAGQRREENDERCDDWAMHFAISIRHREEFPNLDISILARRKLVSGIRIPYANLR